MGPAATQSSDLKKTPRPLSHRPDNLNYVLKILLWYTPIPVSLLYAADYGLPIRFFSSKHIRRLEMIRGLIENDGLHQEVIMFRQLSQLKNTGIFYHEW